MNVNGYDIFALHEVSSDGATGALVGFGVFDSGGKLLGSFPTLDKAKTFIAGLLGKAKAKAKVEK